MTLVGKIFTVLIFVMSLVFMAFAVAVYVTHKNWRDVVENQAVTAEKPYLGYKERLNQETAKRNQLQTEVEEIQRKLNLEQLARSQALAALQTQLTTAQDQLAKEIKAKEDAILDQRRAVGVVETNSTNTAALTAEVERLRTEIRQAMLERDEQFKKVVALTDELQQRAGDLARLKERELAMAAQLAQWEKVRVMMNLGSPESILASNKVPPVRGDVLAVSPEGRLIEISIGSDDGLKEGHMLEVYRGGTYLGRMVVRRTRPDRSVGEMMPNKLGDVRTGDKVTSNKA